MLSGFERLPSQDEVLEYDPRWISDMHLAYKLYAVQTNKSQIKQQFDKLISAQKQQEEADKYRSAGFEE